nr:hypothetical protein [Tanacetum cinerariifolium]
MIEESPVPRCKNHDPQAIPNYSNSHIISVSMLKQGLRSARLGWAKSILHNWYQEPGAHDVLGSQGVFLVNFKKKRKGCVRLIGGCVHGGYSTYVAVADSQQGEVRARTLFVLSSSNRERNFAPTAVLTKSGIVPISTARQSSSRVAAQGDPQAALRDTRRFDSGCSRHMTGNKSFLSDYQEYDGGFAAFTGSSTGGKITGKDKLRTEKLDFEDVYFLKELKFNLFSVSQMCDKKNSVLFTETECLILSLDFKLHDENQVLLKVPRKNNMYSFDLKNVIPLKGLTCLFSKATNDESNLWHKRLGHINFKTMDKLMKGNLIRGFPSKIFENDHTCVACQKGKQHKASCKSKLVNSVSQPLQILHMDLFGPTFIKSIMEKMYCLVVTDDYSRFSWVFFLAKKDKTYGILKDFITGLENQLNHKVKIIRCDNGTEFKNYEMNQFYGIKRIKREFINTACYVENRVLVTKPHNKTPYELLIGRAPFISFMQPFGCPVTILNTLDHLGKFDGKADEGFLVGYFINSKDFRVYNNRTKKVEENLHVNFLENKLNVAGSGPEWLFDIDSIGFKCYINPILYWCCLAEIDVV